MITIFSLLWLTETECLYITNHLGATLEFQYFASQSERAFALVKDVISNVLLFYIRILAQLLLNLFSFPNKRL